MPTSEYLIKSDTLSDIADAIRSKTGESSPIAVNDFASDIGDIKGGYTTTIDGVEVQRDLELKGYNYEYPYDRYTGGAAIGPFVDRTNTSAFKPRRGCVDNNLNYITIDPYLSSGTLRVKFHYYIAGQHTSKGPYALIQSSEFLSDYTYGIDCYKVACVNDKIVVFVRVKGTASGLSDDYIEILCDGTDPSNIEKIKLNHYLYSAFESGTAECIFDICGTSENLIVIGKDTLSSGLSINIYTYYDYLARWDKDDTEDLEYYIIPNLYIECYLYEEPNNTSWYKLLIVQYNTTDTQLNYYKLRIYNNGASGVEILDSNKSVSTLNHGLAMCLTHKNNHYYLVDGTGILVDIIENSNNTVSVNRTVNIGLFCINPQTEVDEPLLLYFSNTCVVGSYYEYQVNNSAIICDKIIDLTETTPRYSNIVLTVYQEV